jgi:DNA-binding transcriptional regulator YiaG
MEALPSEGSFPRTHGPSLPQRLIPAAAVRAYRFGLTRNHLVFGQGSLKAGVHSAASRRSATYECKLRLIPAYDPRMPNIAATLKEEISRIARKEVRSETEDFKKSSAQYRHHIAALRRRIEELERQLKKVSKSPRAAAVPELPESENGVTRRFSPARLAATRKKLGLSAADFGALVGVTGQSIYKWETGAARPRATQLEAIAAVRGIGKREAAEKLAALR